MLIKQIVKFSIQFKVIVAKIGKKLALIVTCG